MDPENSRATKAEELDDVEIVREMRRRTRRSFFVAALAALGGYGGFRWLNAQTEVDGIPGPLRRLLGFNENITRSLFSPDHRAAELSERDLTPGGPRVNGDIGLEDAIDPAAWRLRIKGTDLSFTLDDVKSLPSVTQITPLRCIEGWTTVGKWTGVRLVDFTDKFFPSGRTQPYVGLATPAGDYYVGLDAASAFHTQTLLCYAANDQPLSAGHGAPLRLLIPTKYGIKNLKRVGELHFTTTRPPDYWAEQGYDWYAGL